MGSFLPPVSLSVAVRFLAGSWGAFLWGWGLAEDLLARPGLGLPGGVGAAGLISFTPGPALGGSWRAADPGIWGSERPGEDLVGWGAAAVLVGEAGLVRREGRTGLGLPGTWTGLVGEGEW